ncbi:hypothetical protein [Caldiplasma sukawensis]
MSIFRREEGKDGIHTYHCDEHDFSSMDAAKVEEHMKLHGKKAADFWKKEHHKEKKVTLYSCEHHDFQSYDPAEIEEHERSHALMMSTGWGILER